ncbi:SRPBCC family protein [Pedobacter sp. AW1-32]|uniref:SRPBCC family protein n=1 Tax=Pedobacter sp. AW1-32 TaxID=3383026 RepID=UPI003FEF6F75
MDNLAFDFFVNTESKTIIVKRTFHASLENVWRAWTTAEILDKWWAPDPYRAETKHLDFKNGGYWLYAMVSPQGKKHWSKTVFGEIETLKSFSTQDVFCDEGGTPIVEMPQSFWKIAFIPERENVLVDISITFETLEALEQTMLMGFREGFTAGLNNLEKLLSASKIV